MDTESRFSDASRTIELAEESGALIYTIHYDTAPDVVERQVHARIGANVVTLGPSEFNASVVGEAAYRQASNYLRDLAERTGAKACDANDARSLEKAFSAIAGELRQEYELSYSPANRACDGSYRKIRVVVDRPDTVVRARPGYRTVRETAAKP